ncbi:hypothetical protein [Arthrobacter cupressi]|uniref:DUF4157 domain-containing protein n=1 Tax=Arthrobacter cupressi TaxID=1045773 RepID=A0A1G8S4G5_9MICC|nr:hypothetical protein [Arthrobacter cupressi]NYD79404.1 hypothetical protein [Arthrobacter cupressi]SDJ24051.1 hypothetical protein SAMN05216555_108156 [Arthrobacter cupressi]
MTPGQRLRRIANTLNLSTPLGLLLARAAGARCGTGPRGLTIAAGYRWRLPHAAAFTVGNVVLYRAGPASAGQDPVLLGHEERHSTQYAWCLGLPFIGLYFLCAGWSVLRTGNPGTANFFERQAGLAAGGYPDRQRNGHSTRASDANRGRT